MHEVDLSKYDLRTDLIIEKNLTNINNNHYQKNGIEVDDITLEKNNLLKKKELLILEKKQYHLFLVFMELKKIII